MKNIHLLPTDKPSRLYKSKITQNISMGPIDISQHGDATYNLNIYITSDEEIKEGDWFYNILSLKPKPLKACENGDGYVNCSKYSHYRIDCKKIILTTDEQLIVDGVQSISDDFLQWFIKNPSCTEVVVEKGVIKLNEDGEEYGFPDMTKYKIIIPQEEPKQEIKQDTSKFSKEDLLSAFQAGMMFMEEYKASFEQWYEQYKK
jgi:hypothetical protein